jgi:hypothetical protein
MNPDLQANKGREVSDEATTEESSTEAQVDSSSESSVDSAAMVLTPDDAHLCYAILPVDHWVHPWSLPAIKARASFALEVARVLWELWSKPEGQTKQQREDLQVQFQHHMQTKWGSTRGTAADRRQREVYMTDHCAQEDYSFVLADLKADSPSLTPSQLHSRVEKKLWQNLKAKPIPYLTKAPVATIEEIFNYLRDPRVHQAMMTTEGQTMDWHARALPFVQEPHLAKKLITYAHVSLGALTDHPATRVGGTRINDLLPCLDLEHGFAAGGSLWDKVPWITCREVNPDTTDAWRSLREAAVPRSPHPAHNPSPAPAAAHSPAHTDDLHDADGFLSEQSPTPRHLSMHEQRSEMARAVAQEEAAAAHSELQRVKKQAAEQEAETKAKAAEVLDLLWICSVLDLRCFGYALCWTCSVLDLLCVGSSLCWSCSVLDLLCVGSALCWICSVLDTPLKTLDRLAILRCSWICSVLNLLCVGSGSALCWICFVLVCSVLDLLCVGSALCWIYTLC